MTIDDFCVALAAGTPQDWYLDRHFNDAIRRRDRERGRVCCPLTALTDEHHTSGFYAAATKLGLSSADAITIATAADNLVDDEDFDPVVRLKLMKATILRHSGGIGRRITDRLKDIA